MRSQKLVFLFTFIVFVSAPFAFGFWTKFVVNVSNIDVALGSMEASEASFDVSFDPTFASGTGQAQYYIASYPKCNEYNENSDCIDSVPNLCPYLSLEPQNGESTEIGFILNPDGAQATGELNRSIDETDSWNLVVKSPCFVGECPAEYDAFQNGAPLPQSAKGQTFKCDLSVESNEIPDILGSYFKNNIVYADDLANTLEVSAVFTGEVAEAGFSNVLFLPGLEASRLYTTRAGGSEDQLWETNGNSDVEDLYLNTDGTSKNANIYSRDVIKETNTPIPTGSAGQNIYKSFSEMMDGLVDENKIAKWEPYAYDWRQDVQDIVDNGTKYQNETVSIVATLHSLIDSSKNGKVTIIAHSNGGLIAKALLKKLQDDKATGVNNLIDSVDVLILVAVPEIGTASAVPAVMHGYDQSILGGWLLDETRARELGRNMLGAFGLLPSREYINRVNASPATFVDTAIPSNVTTKLVQAFGSAISSYAEYKDFLFGNEGRVEPTPNQTNLPIGLSESLFTKAENLHNSIDAFAPPSSLRVIEVAGWGLDTVASFEYYPKPCTTSLGCGYTLDQRPRFTSDGDKTVVVPSAHYLNTEKYWVNLFQINNDKFPLAKNIEHKNILETPTVLQFIDDMVQEISLPNYQYITTTTPVDPKNRLRLSIHSPVTLDAYDADGNHTGKICPPGSDFCYVEENIINSSYMEFGEGKYINLPEDELSKIKLQGTDIGTFTYNSEKVAPDGTSDTSSFIDIPVTAETKAEIKINDTGTTKLELDVTGDGVVDLTLNSNQIFDPIAYLQVVKATLNSFTMAQANKDSLGGTIDSIIKSIQKRKLGKAKGKIENLKANLEWGLSRPAPKKPKPGKISKPDAQLLIDMLNKLLDNLN